MPSTTRLLQLTNRIPADKMNNVTAVPATSIKRKERDEDESSDEGSDVVGLGLRSSGGIELICWGRA